MTTGILVSLPGGSKFWHPCKDSASGLREMEAMHAETGVYGAAWGHPKTVVEFGRVDGDTFTPTERLRPVAPPADPAPPTKEA